MMASQLHSSFAVEYKRDWEGRSAGIKYFAGQLEFFHQSATGLYAFRIVDEKKGKVADQTLLRNIKSVPSSARSGVATTLPMEDHNLYLKFPSNDELKRFYSYLKNLMAQDAENNKQNAAAIPSTMVNRDKDKHRFVLDKEYKLYQFPGRGGRSEFVGYILEYMNAPFEEILVTQADWISTYKNQMPTGVLLEMSDGRKLNKSFAIGRYLAAEYGLLSKVNFENAWCDQMVMRIDEIYPVYYRNCVMAMMGNDVEKEVAALEALKGCWKPIFDELETHLGDKKYLCGSKPHWCDFVVAELVDHVENVFDRDLVVAHPKLEAHSNRIHELDPLKEYLKTRLPVIM